MHFLTYQENNKERVRVITDNLTAAKAIATKRATVDHGNLYLMTGERHLWCKRQIETPLGLKFESWERIEVEA